MTHFAYLLDNLRTQANRVADSYYLQAVNLRVSELRVMRILHETPGCTAIEVCERLVLDKTLLSKKLACLESRGLIQRAPHPDDGRLQCLTLTDAGENAWQACDAIRQQLDQQMFAALSDKEWERLQTLLARAFASFKQWERGQTPPEKPKRVKKG